MLLTALAYTNMWYIRLKKYYNIKKRPSNLPNLFFCECLKMRVEVKGLRHKW